MFRSPLRSVSLFIALIAAAGTVPVHAADKAFNPDIGVNFLGLLSHGTAVSNNPNSFPHNGLSLQEAEIQFRSNVDAYFKAVALFALGQETDASGAATWKIEPEDLYFETISLPGVTLRAGKFDLALGRHNSFHTHAFPFIDAPLFQSRIIGDEGLNEIAVSASALIPAPWFSEFTAQAFSPRNAAAFASLSSGHTGYLGRLRNLWDLSEAATIEWGISSATAKNQFDRQALLYGTDVTYKWRPTEGGKYRAFIWSTEYLGARRNGLTNATTGASEERTGGLATSVQYQFAQRWWVQGRVEYFGVPKETGTAPVEKQSALLGFFPTEFSGFRLQLDRLRDRASPKDDRTVSLQYNISMGAHPAHAY